MKPRLPSKNCSAHPFSHDLLQSSEILALACEKEEKETRIDMNKVGTLTFKHSIINQ